MFDQKLEKSEIEQLENIEWDFYISFKTIHFVL